MFTAFWLLSFDLVNYVGPTWAITFMKNYFSKNVIDLCVSNVPTRIEEPMVIQGKEVEWICGFGVEPSAVIILNSYCNTVKLTISADLGCVPSHQVSCKELIEEIEL